MYFSVLRHFIFKTNFLIRMIFFRFRKVNIIVKKCVNGHLFFLGGIVQ